jgi:two-component system response regulator AtoC
MSSDKADSHKNAKTIDPLPPDNVLFGHSPALAFVRRRADKVCQTDVPVLLYGDAGTGKETLARWIHSHSIHRAGQFVKVNCAAIPGSLFESELFGYEKGAFTGAIGSKPGRVELAHGGTLFLDEIVSLDLGLQSKLLHVLQDGRFSRLGDEVERTVSTRIICSTNRDLDQEIEAGRFRADLFYRISVLQLRLPPLRERKEDIPLLAEYLRTAYEKQFLKKSDPFNGEILKFLQNLNWPGNMRELSNAIARYVLIGAEAAIIAEPLERPRSTSATDRSQQHGAISMKRITKEAIREMEHKLILEALRDNQWNRRKTAKELKISYRTLIYKIRDSGLIQRAGRAAPVGQGASARAAAKSVISAE